MKMLLVGMDGAQEESFKRGWTPFIRSLIEGGSALNLKEDLVSRGWAEIVLGQHASSTKAVYEGPLANGSHAWSEKYKLDDTPGLNESVRPIWQVLNEQGYKVGVMNVPTTFPAPEVNGFFVSGGGGGGPVTQDVKPEQCYPAEIQKGLEALNYIVDQRLPGLLGEKKLYDPKTFYAQLQLMNEKRTDAFISLSNRFDVDFGFVVYKTSIVTAETLLLPELERCNSFSEKTDFIKETECFYRHFDSQIKVLVESFPDAQIIFVSDHSTVLRKWSVNVNAFLSSVGMQKVSSSKRSLFSTVKSFKHLIPLSLRKLLKKSSKIKSSYESMTTFDTKKSNAFSMTFSTGQNGIFINDVQRFNGPVKTDDIEKLKDQIVEQFNNHPVAVEHKFKAYKSAVGSVDQFPDIVLDLPDGYLTSSLHSGFVVPYEPKVNKFDLKEAAIGRFHTIKGHHPLSVNINAKWLVEPSDRKHDLTLIYDHISNFFKK